MQVVDNSVLVLRTRDPSKYNIIPKSEVLGEVGSGIYEVAVHWGLHETRVLRNLGVRDVPSPILKNYDWPGRHLPFAHQKTTSAFLTSYRRCFCFSEPGTGKTLAALWAADYLMRIGEVRRCLVLCPLSIMQSAWMGDLASSIVGRSAIVCHHWDSKKRVQMVKNGYEFVIANYDGLPIISKAILEDGEFDLIIVDEANAYKTATTKRWKSLAKIVSPHTHLWLMTGTPAAQSPVDAYGIGKLVNPAKVPQFQTGWKEKVMRQVTRFKWVPKDDAYTHVHEVLQPAIRFTKKECLDLPPVLTETRVVPMTPQQDKYYKLMKKHMIMQAAGEVVTAVNAAAGVSKLLQISAGAAYTDEGEVVEFDCSPRLHELEAVIDETSRKVLVFTTFRHNMDVISAYLDSRGITNEKINGSVSLTRRSAIFKRFQEGLVDPAGVPDSVTRGALDGIKTRSEGSLKVLIVQPQAAQHGVTLTAADTVVFWGPVSSVETYIQCVARMDRQGQTADKVTVVHLQGSPLEARVFKKLEERVTDHAMLVKIYEEELDS